MAKKKNKSDIILKRAEKQFKAGNYLEAEKKFEKVQRDLKSPAIEKKLAICRRETAAIKRKELVARAEKAVNDDDLPLAITCFEQAGSLLNEAWIPEKVRELEKLMEDRDMDARAQTAIASGDHQAAADIFQTSAHRHMAAWETNRNPADLRKAAVSLVKASRFPEAVDLFRQVDDFDDSARYHFGYALARSQKFQEALEQWETLSSRETLFLDQADQVLGCAIDQVCRDLVSGTAMEDILERTKRLLEFARPGKDNNLTVRLDALLDYCNIVSAEISWKAGDYETVEALLKESGLTADSEMIHLKAATLFHLSKTRAQCLETLPDCWLTALEIYCRLSFAGNSSDTADSIRQRLIRMGQTRMNHGNADDKSAESAVICFETIARAMADLNAISGHPGRGEMICSPGYAEILGISKRILELIRDNKNFFRDEAHFLETGGLYSRAGKSLLCLKTKDVESAFKHLDCLNSREPANEFTHYVQSMVQFEYGRIALEKNHKNHLIYFSSTTQLFETVPRAEEKFVDEMLQYEGRHLFDYESLLSFLYKKRPSKPIGRALAFLMGQAAVVKSNQGKITNKQFQVIIQKAMAIDPDNEFVCQLMDQIAVEFETESLFKAMSSRKLVKAGNIAVNSAYPETRTRFFEFGEQIVKQIELSGMEHHFQIAGLHDLMDVCMKVDSLHPLIDTIQMKLEFLEE